MTACYINDVSLFCYTVLPTTAAVISNITPTGPTKDRITIYVIAGIAGFLLILVALFVMCFLKR